MSQETPIFLTEKRAELFKRFCQFEDVWEKFFSDKFIGSITMHRGKGKVDVEWNTKDRGRELSTPLDR